MAALDLHDAALVKECVLELDKKFPNSSRVNRLKAMAKLELRSRYDDASACYNRMIAKEKTNALYYKRRVALLKSQKRNAEAIKELTDYLKKFMNDNEAWSELCDLYVGEQDYAKAAFCAEELILANPHNYLNHLRLAEIQYTLNTPDSLEQARQHYSQAHKLNRDSARVLYGICLTCSSLLSSGQVKVANLARQKELSRLRDYAQARLQQLYEQAAVESQLLIKTSKKRSLKVEQDKVEDLSSLMQQALNF